MTVITAEAMPTVAVVSAALRRAEAMGAQNVIYGQRGTLNDDALVSVSKQDNDVGRAAAVFLTARKALNDTLRTQWNDASAHARDVSTRFLESLLGAAIPGPVTLPSDCGLHPITERVTGLSWDHQQGDEISGCVTTSSADGRVRDSRSFHTRSGLAYFCEHVSL